MAAELERLSVLKDRSGFGIAQCAASTARAAAKLQESPWLREFMVPKERWELASDLSLLTDPLVQDVCATLSGVVQASKGPGLNFVASTSILLVPTLSMGGYTLGFAIHGFNESSMSQDEIEALFASRSNSGRQHTCADSKQACMGRFCFSESDGSLLLLSRLLPSEPDLTVAGLSSICTPSDGSKDTFPMTSLLSRNQIRLVYWPSVCDNVNFQGSVPLGNADRHSLAAVVDRNIFESALDGTAAFADSILTAYVCEQARTVCADCQRCYGASAVCMCRSALVPSVGSDLRVFRTNLRTSQRGLWTGHSDAVFSLPNLPGFLRGPATTFRQRMTSNISIDIDAGLAHQMTSMAIYRSMSLANLGRQVLPSTRGSCLSSELEGYPAKLRKTAVDGGVCGDAQGLLDECESFELLPEIDMSCFDNFPEELMPVVGEDWLTPEENLSSYKSPSSPSMSKYSTNTSNVKELQTQPSATVAVRDDRPSETPAQMRRRKNRESACRSNFARKQRNDALKQDLAESRKRVFELRTAEMTLREESIALRMSIEKQRGSRLARC